MATRAIGNILMMTAAVMAVAADAARAQTPPLSTAQNHGTIVDYCAAEHLGPNQCSPATFWEIKGSCPAASKVVAVSCSLDGFDGMPRLINNAATKDPGTGACVWQFTGLKEDDAPTATISMLCSQGQ